MDVVDLTKHNFSLFALPELKILGCACLIDQDELDWKIFGIEARYAKEMGINNMDKFNQQNPGAIKDIMEWFRVIKTYDGKPPNRFAYDDQVLSAEKTLQIIDENHKFYKDLVSGVTPNKDNLALGKN